MNRGNRRIANRDSDVNALAGVRFPPSKVNNPKETTVTTTGMLFSINPLNCKISKRIRVVKGKNAKYLNTTTN